MIDYYDVLLEVLAFAFGSLISLAMSWYFFKKSDFPSKVTSAMAEDVLSLLIQDKLGIDFVYQARVPKNELPKKLGTPHILQYWLSDI